MPARHKASARFRWLSGTGREYDGRIFRCRRDMSGLMRFIAASRGDKQVIFPVDQNTVGVAFDPHSKQEFMVQDNGVCRCLLIMGGLILIRAINFILNMQKRN